MFRLPLMKALDRSVETLGLCIVTSSVTFIKSVNQSSIKLCLQEHFLCLISQRSVGEPLLVIFTGKKLSRKVEKTSISNWIKNSRTSRKAVSLLSGLVFNRGIKQEDEKVTRQQRVQQKYRQETSSRTSPRCVSEVSDLAVVSTSRQRYTCCSIS